MSDTGLQIAAVTIDKNQIDEAALWEQFP